jgi:hypothetical protein
MAVFLDIVFSFPTVVFSGLLVVAVAYWLLVLIGAADIGQLDAGEGLIGGALDGVDSALDGLDAAADAAEGAVESALDGHGTAPHHHESPDWLAGGFRIGKVPLTVSISAFVLWGWLIGFTLTWLGGLAPSFLPHVLVSLTVLAVSIVLAAVATNISVRPLESLFRTHGARNRKSLIGEVCQISTGRVDDRFGQASAQVGMDDLLFQVRCDKPNAMRKGDLALVVHFDDEREAFVVEPIAAVRAERTGSAHDASLSNPALVNKEV